MTNANVSVYELTVPQFILGLKALKNVVRKAQVWAEPKKVEASTLFQTRLVPDQFSLGRQIQITCDAAKFSAVRMGGMEAPVFEDKEQTFEEFQSRIDKTIKFLETVKPESFDGYEARKASFPWNPGKYLEGKNFLIQHLLPNFYFHLTTSYAILRSIGVDLGKGDFLGEQNWKNA